MKKSTKSNDELFSLLYLHENYLTYFSQTGLGRHVNQHFSSPATAQPTRTQGQPSPNKLIRKNGRKLRYRKKPFSGML